MSAPKFLPGFRLSTLDVAVLVIGVTASIASGMMIPWVGFVIGFVVAHFFLFCNVVRMARPLELIWAAVFTSLAALTILTNSPGWIATAAFALATTVAVVIVEMRKPSYHGVAWQRINPALKHWWDARFSTPE